MNWLFKLLILPLACALTLGPCLAQTNGNALRGSNSITIVVEDLDKNSIACNINKELVNRAIKYPFSAAKFRLIDPVSDADAVEFYVNLSTLYLRSSDYCVSKIYVAAKYVKRPNSRSLTEACFQLLCYGRMAGLLERDAQTTSNT
jgi:hypothetical protein